MIRILIVEDSPTQSRLIRLVLECDPELLVIGEARNGEEAIAMCRRLRPDLITMDIEMPVMDGHEAIRQIMSETPTPVLVVTGLESEAWMRASFQSLQDGALMVLRKPTGLPDQDPEARQLIAHVKTMADVKVVRRSLWLTQKRPEFQRNHLKTVSLSPLATSGEDVLRRESTGELLPFDPRNSSRQLVAIGVSTGGPPTLQTILAGLPAAFPVPVVIVQHISNGFVNGLAKWLDETSPLHVKVAEPGERLRPGMAYLAPDDYHLLIKPSGVVWLDPSPPVGSHRPSVTELFHSVARSYGSQAVGVLLTGMGQDGAEGLKAMRQAGAYTIAQDESSSVIFGMPKVAIEINAVEKVLSMEQIAPHLKQLFQILE